MDALNALECPVLEEDLFCLVYDPIHYLFEFEIALLIIFLLRLLSYLSGEYLRKLYHIDLRQMIFLLYHILFRYRIHICEDRLANHFESFVITITFNFFQLKFYEILYVYLCNFFKNTRNICQFSFCFIYNI